MIPEGPPPAIGDTVAITPDELRSAIAVWLKVMPAHLWRPYHAMLEIDPKRRTDADRVDPRTILADYLAAQFTKARWTATRVETAFNVDRIAWDGKTGGA